MVLLPILALICAFLQFAEIETYDVLIVLFSALVSNYLQQRYHIISMIKSIRLESQEA